MAIAGLELHQHFGELGVAGRARHQTHERRALEYSLAFLLRHAPEYAENLAASVIFLELLQPMENFLFGLVANAAGVVHHQPGGLRRIDLRIPAVSQRADDLLRIVRIHLAPEGLDVEGLHSIFIVREPAT